MWQRYGISQPGGCTCPPGWARSSEPALCEMQSGWPTAAMSTSLQWGLFAVTNQPLARHFETEGLDKEDTKCFLTIIIPTCNFIYRYPHICVTNGYATPRLHRLGLFSYSLVLVRHKVASKKIARLANSHLYSISN